jgi:U3 small nucleolar RNA-associated protein 20
VVKNLKTKDNDERNFTRKVLIEILKITGPYFLHYIIKELKFYLNKGWENHILNYTIYTLL